MSIADVISALNAVDLSPQHCVEAMNALSALSPLDRCDPVAQTVALSAFADAAKISTEFAPAALHARLVALNRWVAHHDPAQTLNRDALMEAAAICPLIRSPIGVEFDEEIFRGLVNFLDELP